MSGIGRIFRQIGNLINRKEKDMEIWKYLYVCIFAVMAWLMTACVSDEQEEMCIRDRLYPG